MLKSEIDFFRRFTQKGQVIQIVKKTDNSNIRGGTSASGDRDMKSALSLVDKGLLSIVEQSKDSAVKSISLMLIVEPDTQLSPLEIEIYNKIKDFNNGNGYHDKKDRTIFIKTSKKEQKAMQRLADLGLIKFSTLNPKII